VLIAHNEPLAISLSEREPFRPETSARLEIRALNLDQSIRGIRLLAKSVHQRNVQLALLCAASAHPTAHINCTAQRIDCSIRQLGWVSSGSGIGSDCAAVLFNRRHPQHRCSNVAAGITAAVI
jgi:hypothetical protein